MFVPNFDDAIKDVDTNEKNNPKIMRDKNNFSNVNLLVEKLETYAADSNYVNTIRSVIEKNNFKLFDNKTISY